MQTIVKRSIVSWNLQNSSMTFSNFGTLTGQISPTCLRQHPSLFFQDFSSHVNDASDYRTATVYSHISRCKAANVAPNMDGGCPEKEPILPAGTDRTPVLQLEKQKWVGPSHDRLGPTRIDPVLILYLCNTGVTPGNTAFSMTNSVTSHCTVSMPRNLAWQTRWLPPPLMK